MLLQIASDLHLELYPERNFNNLISKSAEILALLGDIGNPFEEHYQKFLSEASKNFELVIVIAGNHEYYSSSVNIGINEITAQITSIILKINLKNKSNGINHNIIFLSDSFINLSDYFQNLTVKDYLVYGTTLWSNVDLDYYYEIMFSINDYQSIYVPTINGKSNRSLYIDDVVVKFKSSVLSLTNFLDKNINKKIMVLSHHAPTFTNTSDPMYRYSEVSSVFASDLNYLLIRPNLMYWCYGHTHYNSVNKISDLFNENKLNNHPGYYLSNQKGYDDEDTGYKENFVIEL